MSRPRIPAKSLAAVGEVRAIARLARRLAARRDVVTGIGDDCAVVRLDPAAGPDLLLTSDPVIEGVHFSPGTPFQAVGHKAVGRVLSDIAAMGGEPRWALLDVVARPDMDVAALDALYRGASALARAFNLSIVGGDLARGSRFEVHAFAAGVAPRGAAILRSGARPGDILMVTGALGGSRSGRHLRFLPRVREGRFLRRWATAMIDLSDGLATDLRHLLDQSGVGARLEAAAIPVSAAARRLRDRRSPLDHALRDGEDFELLFTVPSRKRRAFLAAWRKAFDLSCTSIGIITRATRRLECVGRDGRLRLLHEKGFEHFTD